MRLKYARGCTFGIHILPIFISQTSLSRPMRGDCSDWDSLRMLRDPSSVGGGGMEVPFLYVYKSTCCLC